MTKVDVSEVSQESLSISWLKAKWINYFKMTKVDVSEVSQESLSISNFSSPLLTIVCPTWLQKIMYDGLSRNRYSSVFCSLP